MDGSVSSQAVLGSDHIEVKRVHTCAQAQGTEVSVLFGSPKGDGSVRYIFLPVRGLAIGTSY